MVIWYAVVDRGDVRSRSDFIRVAATIVGRSLLRLIYGRPRWSCVKRRLPKRRHRTRTNERCRRVESNDEIRTPSLLHTTADRIACRHHARRYVIVHAALEHTRRRPTCRHEAVTLERKRGCRGRLAVGGRGVRWIYASCRAGKPHDPRAELRVVLSRVGSREPTRPPRDESPTERNRFYFTPPSRAVRKRSFRRVPDNCHAPNVFAGSDARTGGGAEDRVFEDVGVVGPVVLYPRAHGPSRCSRRRVVPAATRS